MKAEKTSASRAIPVLIRTIGNSKGVVLPKPVLLQAGLDKATDAERTVENGTIVLRRASQSVRHGWAQAAAAGASAGDDALVMGEFANEGDSDLSW